MKAFVGFLALLGVSLALPSSDISLASRNTEKPTINTPLGQISGSILSSRLGKQIFSFRGIRYAKAPINELRFQPPVPEVKWEGVFNATQDAPLCPQATDSPTSEDCLFLNVYTTKLPKENEKPKRDVIVYIHGGGFSSLGGISFRVGPQYLLDEDVVLVTFNYRLGTLGFLSTGEKEATGNYGLKDQVLVLKWVKDNIEAFGGNPQSVTIMGYDAGAAAVTLHMVSPMSTGLFHKAIAMSGSSLGNWPIPTNQLELAKKQARLVKCPDDNASNIMKCLKTKPYAALGNSYREFVEFSRDPLIIWSPVIEANHGQERFLPEHPITLIQNGNFAKVPFLSGITKDEYVSKAYLILSNETLLKEFNEKFEKVAPIMFMYERDSDNSKEISKALKKIYLEDKPLEKTKVGPLAELYADSLVGFGVNRAVKLISEKSDKSVFYYKFSYQGRYSHFYTPQSNRTEPFGVADHDDLIYLFWMKNIFPQFKDNSPVEVEMVAKMIKLWANFAKTGNPIPEPNEKLDNVKWEPFNTKTQKFMEIGNKLVLGEKLNEKRYSEWEKLFPLTKYTKGKHSG